jgi:hypothetical protein
MQPPVQRTTTQNAEKNLQKSKVTVMQQRNVISRLPTEIIEEQPHECSQSSTKVYPSLKGENHPKRVLSPCQCH